ncbi:MAG: O-antigen ligase family protein [Bacilli bacterium]|nr:O-antigen ligase family protein [Bacilli bacterium]
MKKKKILDIIVMAFLVLNSLIDLFGCFQDKYLNIPVSINYIIRGLFFLGIFIYLFTKKDNRKLLIVFLVYFLLAISSYFMRSLNLYEELVNILKIFYLPIMMMFFAKYRNEYIDDRFILGTYFLYIITFVIMYIFKVNKEYLNTIGVILVGLLPITLNYVLEAKSYILKIVFGLALALSIYLISTKLIVLGVFLVTLCTLFGKYKYEFIYNDYKKRLKIILIFLAFIGVFVLLVRFSPFFVNVKNQIIGLNIHSFKDVYKLRTIDRFVFSGGITRVDNVMGPLLKHGYTNIMYGIGKTGIVKYTGIDIFDIFATTGLFGGVIFIIMFSFIHRKTELKKVYYFSYLVFVITSIFIGSVLIYPSISLLMSTLYLVSFNSDKIVKKKSC